MPKSNLSRRDAEALLLALMRRLVSEWPECSIWKMDSDKPNVTSLMLHTARPRPLMVAKVEINGETEGKVWIGAYFLDSASYWQQWRGVGIENTAAGIELSAQDFVRALGTAHARH